MTEIPLTRDRIVDIVGRIDDQKVVRILEIGPTRDELMEAFAWANKASDVMGHARRPLSGRVARVYDVLVGDEEYWDDAS